MQNTRELYYENNDEDNGVDQERGRYQTLITEQQAPNEYQSLQHSINSTNDGERKTSELVSKNLEDLRSQLKKIKYCQSLVTVLAITVAVISVIAVTLASIGAANRNEVLLLKEQVASLQHQLTGNVSDRIKSLQTSVNVLRNEYQQQFPLTVYDKCHNEIVSCVTILSNGTNLLGCKTTPSLNITQKVQPRYIMHMIILC